MHPASDEVCPQPPMQSACKAHRRRICKAGPIACLLARFSHPHPVTRDRNLKLRKIGILYPGILENWILVLGAYILSSKISYKWFVIKIIRLYCLVVEFIL